MTRLIQLLSDETALPIRDVERIIRTAPRRYKVFTIPKRNGGRREIAQPAREVKLLQRVLLATYLVKCRVHASAYAYVKGRSIGDNATLHLNDSPILKMDFRDFFPSIKASDWASYCARNGVFSDVEDIENSANLLFRRAKGERTLKLSIGAPSSPMLSNILLFDLDTEVSLEADKRGITYSRYADDLTFSGQRIGMLNDMVGVVKDVARRLREPRLTVNDDKTVFATKAGRRKVTGLVLTNENRVSLGRDWKRKVSAQLHHASQGTLNQSQMQHLAGNLSYANSVEPEFLRRMETKYGNSVVDPIRRMVVRRRL